MDDGVKSFLGLENGLISRLIVILTLTFVLISSSVVSAASCPEQKFCILDAYNSTGNFTIKICAGTLEKMNYFNVWYNGTGPLNFTASGTDLGIMTAIYADGNPYDELTGLTNETGGGCVHFVLNGSTAPFNVVPLQINVSIYNTTYPVAQTTIGNATMITANYLAIETRNAAGTPVPNVMLMDFDNTTKTFLHDGPALTDSTGYFGMHCLGVINGIDCVNVTESGAAPNECLNHEIAFPVQGAGAECQINISTYMFAIDMITANRSVMMNVTPGIPAVMTLNTPTAMTSVMPQEWSPDSMQQMQSVNANGTNVSDYYTGELLFTLSSGEGGGGPPAFLSPYKFYNISFTYQGTTYAYPFMIPSAGMTSAQVMIPNTTTFPSGSSYRTVYGKVVNETNHPVANASVYAQFYKGPGGAFGIMFFNSAITDANGMFSLSVPRTRSPGESQNNGFFPVYQFYIVSNKTSANGVPMYYPTIDNNKNKGYFASSNPTILPPLVIKAGGRVDISVALNNATMIMSELSKFLNTGIGVSRDAVTGKFSMLSMFDSVTLPQTISMSLLSPVGSVIVNLFGKDNSLGDPMSGNIINTCINTSGTVTQGGVTSLGCNLTIPGYFNISTWTCNNIFDINLSDSGKCSMNEKAGSFNFWFEQTGIIRNGSQIVMYLNPEGTLLENLVGFGNERPSLSVPLPPGDYTFETVSSFEYPRYLDVYNRTSFSIVAGQQTKINMTRATAWDIQPRFNPSMVLSGNNMIEIGVSVKQGSQLNNTRIVVNARILYPNRTLATNNLTGLTYNESKNMFYNDTFNLSARGLTAGKYLLWINVTNKTIDDISYRTTFMSSIQAFDFQVGLDLGGFTFGTGQLVNGKIFAFDATSPVTTGAGNITIVVYDSAGARVTVNATVTDITNGMGNINITMPSSLGFYEVTAKVNASGRFGVADNWMQVSNLNIRTITDRNTYKPADNVILTVKVSNSSNDAPMPNASIEITVDNDNTPALGVTNGEGKATVVLEPSVYSSSGSTWSFGWHNLKIKISKNTGTDVVKLETWMGFDVRGMELFIRPSKPSFGTADNVTLSIFGPPPGSYSIAPNGIKVDGTTLLQGPINDCTVTSGNIYCVSDQWGSSAKEINLGTWSAGHHNVEIKISGQGGDQSFFTGYDVSAYNIVVMMDRFDYKLGNQINATIKASYPNGTAVANSAVNVTMYKAQPPNDIYVNFTNATTNANGTAILALNVTQPGFNYLKINIGGQLQYIGFQVSSTDVKLQNAFGDGASITSYEGQAGSTTIIYVNATSGGLAVADGSIVKVKLWSFGNYIDIPSNTTTGGLATVSVSIAAFTPAQKYGLEVRVTTPNGDQGFAPPSSFTVSGGNALRLSVMSDRSFLQPYKVNDTAKLNAKLTYSNGTGVSGYSVVFEVGSEGSMPQSIGMGTTGADGTISKTLTINSNYTDGPYYVHAYVNTSSDVQAYSGFMVSSLSVNLIPQRSVYSIGENITLNITVMNRVTGVAAIATSGFYSIFNKEKGEIQQSFTPSGTQPYQLNIPIPNETGAVGTYPIGVIMFVNQSQGFGFTLVDVRDPTKSLNMSLPSTITAGLSIIVNITASTGTTAALRIFSPAAQQLIYENASLTLTGGSALVNTTINKPGMYVFNSFVSGIGSNTTVRIVAASTSGTAPAVWTGTSLTANTSSFTTANDVYISTNTVNATATIMTADTTTNTTTTYSLPLNQVSGTNYYGIFSSTNLISGRPYFVRLDTSTTSGEATALFRVS